MLRPIFNASVNDPIDRATENRVLLAAAMASRRVVRIALRGANEFVVGRPVRFGADDVVVVDLATAAVNRAGSHPGETVSLARVAYIDFAAR